LYLNEGKGFAEKAICKTMKIKGKEIDGVRGATRKCLKTKPRLGVARTAPRAIACTPPTGVPQLHSGYPTPTPGILAKRACNLLILNEGGIEKRVKRNQEAARVWELADPRGSQEDIW
jgi:hypothetical protein